MSEVYPAQYHRTDTKKILPCSVFFLFAPTTSLQNSQHHIIIKAGIRERGNDDGSFKVTYESPFTANYACSHCAEDLPLDRYRGVFLCCWSPDACHFRVPCVYPYPTSLGRRPDSVSYGIRHGSGNSLPCCCR